MLNMNHWDVGELAVPAAWNKRHIKSGTLGLISSFDSACGSKDIMREIVTANKRIM